MMYHSMNEAIRPSNSSASSSKTLPARSRYSSRARMASSLFSPSANTVATRSTREMGDGNDMGLAPSAVALVHQPREPFEQIAGVVRPRRGLGVVLDAEDRQPVVAYPLDGLVVE